MSKLRINSFSISNDGYGAGLNQRVEEPLGIGGEALHDWMVATRTFKQTYGDEGGTTGEGDSLPPAASRTSAPGSWAVTCLGRSAVPGRMTGRRDGGAIIRPTTALFSCSPTTRATLLPWKGALASTLSPMAFTRRLIAPARRRGSRMCVWVAERPPFANIFRQA